MEEDTHPVVTSEDLEATVPSARDPAPVEDTDW